jgi:alanine-alpha-ketoisovalerate/valine-pyruvate aminotransferase
MEVVAPNLMFGRQIQLAQHTLLMLAMSLSKLGVRVLLVGIMILRLVGREETGLTVFVTKMDVISNLFALVSNLFGVLVPSL